MRDIVIVGAGIIGAALAWQLARAGHGQRVLVLERGLPMAGSTSRAAALVTLLRSDPAQIAMAQETLAAIAHFEAQAPGAVGHHPVGSLHVVLRAQLPAFRTQLAVCSALGVRTQWVDAAYASARAPWLHIPADADVLQVQDDCYVDAYQLGMAYLQAAQQGGVQVRLQTPVARLAVQGNTVCGVELPGGERVAARQVVVAGGAWSNLLTTPAGVSLPMAPVRSQYWITAPALAIPRDSAIVFVPAIKAYARPEVGGMLFGLREAHSAVADARQLPLDLEGFAFDTQDPNGWNSLAEGASALQTYWPGLEQAPVAHYVSGPSNYTVDRQLVLGKASTLAGLWVASGCNGSGITFAAGMGQVLAQQLLGLAPPWLDSSPMAVQRHGSFDPFDAAFLSACAAARSGKATG